MIERKDTLRDQVFSLIRDKIIRQELSFGARLNIADLSREFQVSNSPIREAITLLVNDGLVECIPNVGFRVINLDRNVFDSLTEVMRVLLTGCYNECVYAGTTDALTRCLAARYEAQQAAFSSAPAYDYANIAIDFDRGFVDACCNPRLTRMFTNKFYLLVLCSIYLYRSSADAMQSNMDEHQAILQAVSENDHQRVILLLYKHYHKTALSF